MAGAAILGATSRKPRTRQENLQRPKGYTLIWSGHYENHAPESRSRLKVLYSLTVFADCPAAIRKHQIGGEGRNGSCWRWPFALVGAVGCYIYYTITLDCGVVGNDRRLMGLERRDGCVHAVVSRPRLRGGASAEGQCARYKDLEEVRSCIARSTASDPRLMTVTAMFRGPSRLVGRWVAGADMMKRVAAGLGLGECSSFILELLVYPVLYSIWKWRFVMKRGTVFPLPSTVRWRAKHAL